MNDKNHLLVITLNLTHGADVIGKPRYLTVFQMFLLEEHLENCQIDLGFTL